MSIFTKSIGPRCERSSAPKSTIGTSRRTSRRSPQPALSGRPRSRPSSTNLSPGLTCKPIAPLISVTRDSQQLSRLVFEKASTMSAERSTEVTLEPSAAIAAVK